MPSVDNAKYQASLRARKLELGLVPVQVYVHHTRKDELRALASDLQDPKPPAD